MRDTPAFPLPDADEDAPPSSEQLPVMLPPELKNLPDAELRRVHVAATLYARKKTKSKVKGDELVSDVFIKLTTTRRWNPDKGPFLPYVLRAIKSMLSHQYESAAPEHEEAAHEGFYREEHRDHEASPEDRMLDHGEQLDRQADAARQLAELEKRIAGHPLMPRVFDCRAKGMEPGEIARTLDVPDADVYSAIKLLKRHMKRIREQDAGGSEEE